MQNPGGYPPKQMPVYRFRYRPAKSGAYLPERTHRGIPAVIQLIHIRQRNRPRSIKKRLDIGILTDRLHPIKGTIGVLRLNLMIPHLEKSNIHKIKKSSSTDMGNGEKSIVQSDFEQNRGFKDVSERLQKQ